jgi:hypothetical protein
MTNPFLLVRLASTLAIAASLTALSQQTSAAEPQPAPTTTLTDSHETGHPGIDPYVPYRQANFYVGDVPYQMYVQSLKPQEPRHKFPIVFVHGGRFDGYYWLATSEGRVGHLTWLPRVGMLMSSTGQARVGHFISPTIHSGLCRCRGPSMTSSACSRASGRM